jgi:PIN domain nuclease of toxin-antitoxin system
MTRAVLDASALLAVLLREPGTEIVAPVLYGALVSAVNYSEVFKKAIERRGEVQTVEQLLDRQALEVIPFDRARAIAAAQLLPQTSPHGLSFADRACLATGREFGLPVFTAEARMGQTELDVDVTMIRERSA